MEDAYKGFFFSLSAYFDPDTLEQHIGWASRRRHRDGWDLERSRHNNISQFITPASWFMSEKQHGPL